MSTRCSPSSSGSAAPRASSHFGSTALGRSGCRRLHAGNDERVVRRPAGAAGRGSFGRKDHRDMRGPAMGGQQDLVLVALRRTAGLVAGCPDDPHARGTCPAGPCGPASPRGPGGPGSPFGPGWPWSQADKAAAMPIIATAQGRRLARRGVILLPLTPRRSARGRRA